MPNWKNTIQPIRKLSFASAVALVNRLGYEYILWEGIIYQVVDANMAIRTTHTLE